MYGILWDCDGTIMDTERLYAYAWQTHLKQFGLSIPEDEIKQFVGVDDRIVHSFYSCLLYTSPSPRDRTRSRMPSSA